MKTLKAFILSFVIVACSSVSFAQTTKNDTLDVAGVCGMCKKKIETAAKSAGASFASWSPDSKKLVISYNPAATNSVKVQQSVAAAGYDTPEVKATEAAYTNLHECCKYDRTAAAAKADCCANGKCTKGDDCCKAGTCAKDASCCAKTGGAACCEPGAGCCKDGKCSKHAARKA